MFERRADHPAARDACGPERDPIAFFLRCICSAVSAVLKTPRAVVCVAVASGGWQRRRHT